MLCYFNIRLRTAHYNSYCIIEITLQVDTRGNSRANTCHKKYILLYIEHLFVIKPKCFSIVDDS